MKWLYIAATFDWCGLQATTPFSCWRDIGKIRKEVADQGVVRLPRFLRRNSPLLQGDQRLKADGAIALQVLQLVSLLQKDRPIKAVLLIRDLDNQPERRIGLEQAREEFRQRSSPLVTILGTADSKREAWVLNGFEPQNDNEEAILAELREVLGFDPLLEAHRYCFLSHDRGSDMIVFVDLEHARLQQEDPERGQRTYANRLRVKYRLEDIAGEPCLLMRYNHVTPERLRELQVRALFVSGNSTEFEHYAEADLAGLRSVFREAHYPTIAFCGGCQILAQSYGAEIGPIGALPTGVNDPAADLVLAPGMIQERGFMPVTVVNPHPLFAGLGSAPVFLESHYWEVKALPPGFHLFASTEKCRLQLIAHESRPLIATQFHPEFYDESHPDGQILLANFCRLYL